MGTPLCKLNLIWPRALTDSIVTILDGLEPGLDGYTLHEGAGRGAAMRLTSTAEQVQGSMRVTYFHAVMPKMRVDEILEAIRTNIPQPHMVYWTEPVSDFGRLRA